MIDPEDTVYLAEDLIFFHVDPGFASLRGDPRYAEVVRQIGLQ